MSRNKFNAVKTTVDGIQFDSKGEARRYGELKLMQHAGEITGLEVHPKFELQPGFARGKRRLSAIKYTADFTYVEGGIRVVEDFKGMMRVGADFGIKKRLFMKKYPDVLFRVTRHGKKTDEWMPN